MLMNMNFFPILGGGWVGFQRIGKFQSFFWTLPSVFYEKMYLKLFILPYSHSLFHRRSSRRGCGAATLPDKETNLSTRNQKLIKKQLCTRNSVHDAKKSNLFHILVFSCKIIALYFRLIKLKDYLDFCLTCSKPPSEYLKL